MKELKIEAWCDMCPPNINSSINERTPAVTEFFLSKDNKKVRVIDVCKAHLTFLLDLYEKAAEINAAVNELSRQKSIDCPLCSLTGFSSTRQLSGHTRKAHSMSIEDLRKEGMLNE